MQDVQYAGPARIPDEFALDLLADMLSAQEWNASYLEAVADVVRATGRTVADVDGEDGA